jgi:formate hydrogenlyase subunit 6/NADH:ubiquinone oxidoreductase subunit I
VDGKAVFLDPKQDKAPRYDYKKCIRCYCCQEMCPAKAITVWQPIKKKKEGAGE